MVRESKFQSEVAKWLRSMGFYVLVTTAGRGIPAGCPDIIALKGTMWLAIECKASDKSVFQPGQRATLNFLKYKQGNDTVYVAWPDNWEIIKKDIVSHFSLVDATI